MKNNPSDTIESVMLNTMNELSKYCIIKCKAKCCKKGKLLLDPEKGLAIFTKDKIISLLKEKTLTKRSDNNYELDISVTDCPKLKENRCMIYSNPDRPKICAEFPIFIKNKTMMVATFCPVIKQILKGHLKELKDMGYRLIYQ